MADSQGLGKGHRHCVLGRTRITGSAHAYIVLVLIPGFMIHENAKLTIRCSEVGCQVKGGFRGCVQRTEWGQAPETAILGCKHLWRAEAQSEGVENLQFRSL